MLVTSSTERIWDIKNSTYGFAENIVDIILQNRGVSKNDLDVSIKKSMPDPYVFVDMQRAAERIVKAIENKESIAILGDYDVDGVSSTAIFVKFFQYIGVDYKYAIPDRMKDGYGLNKSNIDKFQNSLIITVDNGAAAIDELKYAHDKGIEIIVVDHHEMSIIPENTIVVDPFRPDDQSKYRYLCATGLAMMCVIAINRLLRERGFYRNRQEPDLMSFLDLVALATICDVVPLVGLNRAFVTTGLKILQRRKNYGINAMMNLANKKDVDSESVGFFFGPRLNASGRLSSAMISLELLTTKDEKESSKLAAQLEQLNEQRKCLDQEMFDIAETQIDLSQKFICAYGNDWHAGVIGIVAGRLKEKYNMPTIVISCDNGDLCHASCRSTDDVDISKVIRKGIEKQVIVSGGGHASAGGFVVLKDKINELIEFLKMYDFPDIKPKKFDVECRISVDDISDKLIENINTLEPFGQCNERPRFVIEGLIINKLNLIKEKHISLSFENSTIRGISFNATGSELEYILQKKIGVPMSIMGTLAFSTWRNQRYINLLVEDIE